MRVQRGDIVLVDFPFSDRTGSKVRPAVVVQDDRWNAALDDTILALITGSRRRRVGSATQRFVAVSAPEAAGTGLRIDSVVQCEILITVDQSLIVTTLGRFGTGLMDDVDKCLKASLSLA